MKKRRTEHKLNIEYVNLFLMWL